jgi:thiol-disulfide isomerase/thioredoxin
MQLAKGVWRKALPLVVRLDYPAKMRRILLLLALVFLLCPSGRAAQQPPVADQVLAAAESQAVAAHKPIFLVFGASWCPPCRQMEAFMEDREIRPILEKYVVLASLHVQEQRGKHPELESPGGEKLLGQFGGESKGVPFLVFLDERGQLLINSNRPVKGKTSGENIGYPALPEEIYWFMAMLKKSLPTLAKVDADTIEKWLRGASSH